MPIYKLSSRDRRALRNRQIETWAKWAAVVLSATLLAATLLLLHTHHALMGGPALPTSAAFGRPVIAR